MMGLHALIITSGLDPADGGMQTLARLAWDAFGQVGPRSLISFGPADPSASAAAARSVVTTSKLALLTQVLCRRWPVELGLFTHIELVKLLPLLRGGPRRVVAFVLGIEAWRPLGRLTRRALRRVDLFVSISRHSWERFRTVNPEFAGCRHAILYLGIGEPVGRELPPPARPPTALILGRMARGEDYKGHRELITVWPRVRQSIPEARLWVVGDGTLRPELQALAEQTGVGSAVTFFGRVPEDHKQDLIARSRCFVMPSRGEGFGFAYLEAMRLGRPCLVSDQDAGREVVAPPDAGLAVDPHRCDDLADAVVQLLTPGLRWDAWSAAARRRYEASFTAAHFQRRLLDLLGEPAK
jgi:phosphatidyl-myo-inositol dimannoside synthase